MAARYSPGQRFAASKFALNCSPDFGPARTSVEYLAAAKELRAAQTQVHALYRADTFKVWSPTAKPAKRKLKVVTCL